MKASQANIHFPSYRPQAGDSPGFATIRVAELDLPEWLVYGIIFGFGCLYGQFFWRKIVLSNYLKPVDSEGNKRETSEKE
ncbi:MULTISPECIES: hypothetical protein [unclassified Rhizobium]|uniref:hypothetical protein n=1 Tax=unclassified Rhizobium TaxID=2613769 RepID=UPI0037FD93C2